MNMQMLHIGSLCIVKILKLFVLTVLEWVESVLVELENVIAHKNVKTNIFRI